MDLLANLTNVWLLLGTQICQFTSYLALHFYHFKNVCNYFNDLHISFTLCYWNNLDNALIFGCYLMIFINIYFLLHKMTNDKWHWGKLNCSTGNPHIWDSTVVDNYQDFHPMLCISIFGLARMPPAIVDTCMPYFIIIRD